MTGLYLPGAAWRPISYRAASGLFAAGHPIGYIPHVQVGNGSLWAFFNRLTSPNRLFSNAWVAKDGHSEQYAETNRVPWAQGSGNPDYLAFECEGHPSEPYTAAQINTLAIWHNFLGTPDGLANAPGQHGVGTHAMGGAAYGGHTCPGPGPRAGQRAAIIARAKVLRGVTPKPPIPPKPPVPPKPKPAPVVPAFPGTTRQGSSGRAVTLVQGRLKARGWSIVVDGKFGQATDHIVRLFQREKHLGVDGIVGPATWRALWLAPTS